MSSDPQGTPGAFADLPDAIRRLQHSTRRSIPMAVMGLLLTLIAAGVAIYYILTLSSDLDRAQHQLANTMSELDRTQATLRSAETALERVTQSAPGTQSEVVQAALSEVRASAQALESASGSLEEATDRLPESGEVEAQTWFSVVGSFEPTDAGLAEARQRLLAHGAERCLEIRRTSVLSHNYALVLGGEMNRDEARRQAALARESGLAPDAYAQLNRQWQLIERSPGCPEAASQ